MSGSKTRSRPVSKTGLLMIDLMNHFGRNSQEDASAAMTHLLGSELSLALCVHGT